MEDLTEEGWAEAVWTLYILLYGPFDEGEWHQTLPYPQHPAVMIQTVSHQTFRPTSPTEVYSDERPIFVPQTREEETWRPIDILYGLYEPHSRTIKIFIKNIEHDAYYLFRCYSSDFEFIVRLHEYAHAMVHLGISWKEEGELIRKYPPGQETDWAPFLAERTKTYSKLPEEVHEWVAQYFVWTLLGMLGPEHQRTALQDVFVRIMDRQPPHYKLSDKVRVKKAPRGWSTVLLWSLRNEPCAPSGVSAVSALQALLGLGH